MDWEEITQKELAYFMGRVDTQLTQILEMLKEQQTGLKVVPQLERRVEELEGWKDEIGDHTNIVTFQWVREKLQVPIIIAVIIFLLTTILPAILAYKNFIGG